MSRTNHLVYNDYDKYTLCHVQQRLATHCKWTWELFTTNIAAALYVILYITHRK